MNILVTGGAGFIGSHIADAYLDAGHHVVILDNLSTGRRDLIPERATFYHADLTTAELGKIIQQESIEVINHHAAQTSVQEAIRDPLLDANSNIIGTLQLLGNGLSFNIKRVILASTGGAMYGDSDRLPADESQPAVPTHPYAISKLGAEHYLQFFQKVHRLPGVVLRYSNVFGPRQNPEGEAGVVAIHCHRLNRGESPLIFGDGEQTRDFISVRDIVNANLLALDPEISGIFNVGTGIETSINDLTKTLIELSGQNSEIEYFPAKPGELKRSALNADKFRKLGWSPMQNLKEGLLDTFRYFKENDG